MFDELRYTGYMEFVDTHCHIQSSSVVDGPAGEAVTRSLWAKVGHPSGDSLIAHAAEAGVTRMVCVGCDIGDSQLAVDFVADRPACWASIGIHPHEAGRYASGAADSGSVVLDEAKLADFTALAASAKANKVLAVGECGLDYFYEHSKPAEQQAILRYQLQLAQTYDLPMIFHVREAFGDFWPIFDEFHSADHPIRGVVHSFTDTAVNLDQALARGLYIGVNGIATFTKSQEQRDMYKSIPLSRILLETDSPFLTPSPYRGTICEPYHISVTAGFLAELRNEPLTELAASTRVNARNLFNL